MRRMNAMRSNTKRGNKTKKRDLINYKQRLLIWDKKTTKYGMIINASSMSIWNKKTILTISHGWRVSKARKYTKKRASPKIFYAERGGNKGIFRNMNEKSNSSTNLSFISTIWGHIPFKIKKNWSLKQNLRTSKKRAKNILQFLSTFRANSRLLKCCL